RMLDMGFIADIEFLISKLMVEKQSLFFSATMSDKAEIIANRLLKNPVKIQVEKQSPIKNIDQDVVRVNSQDKLQVLHDLLKNEEFEKVLIFSRTKRGADKIALRLRNSGFQIDAIHSNKTQNSRMRTIKMFKAGNLRILVATDVASRGLDIDDITHVINYDEPQSYEDYIHRIGRTGRAGKMGTALTFIG
ncbi:DEAD/DEAH box helicase, partial [Candidatus Dojkabacteria bacterium]|nr:DEAD/DEAH box helicase [Candidatus Dojkabacteria bacterium]